VAQAHPFQTAPFQVSIVVALGWWCALFPRQLFCAMWPTSRQTTMTSAEACAPRGDGRAMWPTSRQTTMTSAEDADSEADGMNQERQFKDFFVQVSGDSALSGASTTHTLEELSSREFFSNHCSNIDALASRVIDEESIRNAISSAVADSGFCASVADPRQPDVPLIAVSSKFERITGYCMDEVLGKNCRFLNKNCNPDFEDLIRLRSACESGSSFTGVLINQKKSGELFLNLLDLRGLNVARNPRTGEDLWFLIGIQADITDVDVPTTREDQLAEMHMVANSIRSRLTDQLSALAVAGALANNYGICTKPETPVAGQSDAWCLLPVPVWRSSGSTVSSPTPLSSPRVEPSRSRTELRRLVAVGKESTPSWSWSSAAVATWASAVWRSGCSIGCGHLGLALLSGALGALLVQHRRLGQ